MTPGLHPDGDGALPSRPTKKMIDENKMYLYLWVVWIRNRDGSFRVGRIYEAERWAKRRKTVLESYGRTVYIQPVRILIEVPWNEAQTQNIIR